MQFSPWTGQTAAPRITHLSYTTAAGGNPFTGLLQTARIQCWSQRWRRSAPPVPRRAYCKDKLASAVMEVEQTSASNGCRV
jgi:hypothetical protein